MKNKFENYEKFTEFFSTTKPSEIVEWQKGKAFIDFEWMYSELVNREDVKKAIANIMSRNNSKYIENSQRMKRRPEDIEGFSVVRKNGEIFLSVVGADNYSMLKIYKQGSLEYEKENRYHKILFDDLNNEILNVISEDKDLDEKQKKLMLIGIEEATNEAFGNIVEYYKYLSKLYKESKEHICTISPRTDEKNKKIKPNPQPKKSYTRKNDIIPFYLREKMLESNHPYAKVSVAENTSNGEVISNAYTAYVYKKMLKGIDQVQEGYLFVCEPSDGDRSTKIMYLNEKDYDEFEKDKKQDKLAAIVQKYLEMSQGEFFQETGTLMLSHTNLESYAERLNFFINGEKGKSLTALKEMQERMKQLYKNPEIKLPYYKQRNSLDIALIGSEAIQIDRTAQNEIEKNNDRGELNGN